MLSMDIKHPDAELFIDKKVDTSKVTGANISVKISDEFMESVKYKGKFKQQFPIDAENPIMEKEIDSKKLWKKIIHNAWKSAEPGILFWDTFLNESPAKGYGERWKEKSTNPCAELALNEYDSCRLLAINLFSYVNNPFTKEAQFDFGLFKKHVRYAQRLMDDIVDLEIEKIDKIIEKVLSDPEPLEVKQVELNLWKNIKNRALEGRRTGLGVTAEGDMLAALNMVYGTKLATSFSEDVHKNLAVAAYESSIDMAEERGTFKIWDREKDLNGGSKFIDRIYKQLSSEYQKKWIETGRRNIALLTIAPTGTTSLMTQTTSGIESVFMPFYKRRRKTEDPEKCVFTDEVGDMWEEYMVVHPKYKMWYEINRMGFVGIDKVDIEDLTEEEMETIYKMSPYYKATSNDVDYLGKVDMQGRVQKWVDHSISVTINMPKDVTEETVGKVYMKAWEVGCKGVTVYRDGSRSGVLISGKEENKEGEIIYNDAPKRPKNLPVDVYHKMALGKEFTILVGLLKGKPYEIFAFEQLSQSDFPKEIERAELTRVRKNHYRLTGYRGEQKFVIENIVDNMNDDEKFQTRDFSRSLRHGEHPKYICNDIDKSSFISSFRKVVSRVLKNYLTNEDVKDKCPDCGGELKFESGCKSCDCGWSACG